MFINIQTNAFVSGIN